MEKSYNVTCRNMKGEIRKSINLYAETWMELWGNQVMWQAEIWKEKKGNRIMRQAEISKEK